MKNLHSDIQAYLISQLEDEVGLNDYGCDLSNSLLNQDYFIIGTYQAKLWLGDFAFDAIKEIQDYENDNFGEVFTDLGDPEKVANMYCLIKGEELLNNSNHYTNKSNEIITEEDLSIIKEELKCTTYPPTGT